MEINLNNNCKNYIFFFLLFSYSYVKYIYSLSGHATCEEGVSVHVSAIFHAGLNGSIEVVSSAGVGVGWLVSSSIWVDKVSADWGGWLSAAGVVGKQLEGNRECDKCEVRPANSFETESVKERNIGIDSRSLAHFSTVTACTLVVAGVTVNKSIFGNFHCAAVSFTSQWRSRIITETECNNRKTLVFTIDSKEVHESKGWSDISLSNEGFLFTRLEDIASIVGFHLEVD